MSRKLYLLLLLLSCIAFQGAFAQKRYMQPHYVNDFPSLITNEAPTSKLDLRLYKRLLSGNIQDKNTPLLVRGNMNTIEALTQKYGGHYKYGYNGISSVSIPEKNLLAFSREEAIEHIESTMGKGTFLMDTARIRNNIDSAQAGFAPLVQGLKGKDVVMGIIDEGLDWRHYDFKNPTDSTTRIKYLWDQLSTANGSATIPGPYNYGRQWTSTEINNNTCGHVANDNGHGTCVTGIAAGNSLSTKNTPYQGLYTGVAPETDIIFVRISDDYSTGVPDAVDYIFKKADSLGKPCVINTSIGDYYGSHDGNDDISHLLEAMITAKNGRAIVAAAGNAGQIAYHLSYPIPADSAYTSFNYNPTYQDIYFDWWTDVADFQNAFFAIGCNSSGGANLGLTAYYNVPANFNPQAGTPVYYTTELFSYTNVDLGEVNMRITLDGGRYHVEVDIYPIVSSNTWRLQMKGSGTFDLRAHPVLTTSSSMNTNGSDPHYRNPDYDKNMVSSWQNSDKVITVGNYSNRANYVDYNGNTVDLTQSPYWETVGQLFGTSSHGPTRDNRIKPDVVATGSTTVCTGDASYITSLINAQPSQAFKVSVTGKHVRNGGTSMASPIVAGIAALYFEKYPNVPWSEVKDWIICTAREDNFTGATPNNGYGHGKVNGFDAVTHRSYGITDTGCLNYSACATVNSGVCVPKVYGVMDTGCINYNPLANVSGGVCVPKVYGVMDTTCINYNPLANVSGGEIGRAHV